MKARDSVYPMTPSNQLCLAQLMEDICSKITSISDRFHIKAGLFKEVNCDKDVTSVDTNSDQGICIPITSGIIDKFTPRHIAEQLTLYDAQLFAKIIPSECLNHVRHKPAKSVDATIKQFNRVYGLVQTTIIDAEHVMPTTPSSTDISGASLTSLTLSAVTAPLQTDRPKQTRLERPGSHSSLARSANNVTSIRESESSTSEDVFLRAEILTKWISVAAVSLFFPHFIVIFTSNFVRIY